VKRRSLRDPHRWREQKTRTTEPLIFECSFVFICLLFPRQFLPYRIPLPVPPKNAFPGSHPTVPLLSSSNVIYPLLAPLNRTSYKNTIPALGSCSKPRTLSLNISYSPLHTITSLAANSGTVNQHLKNLMCRYRSWVS